MESKSRLGRKDIFTANKETNKAGWEIAVKGRRKNNIKPGKQITRKTENQKKIKVTFQIPENLFIQIKIKAAKERKKISDLVGKIFKEYLDKETRK